VRVRYVEGLAIHSGLESCAGTREGASEALTDGTTGRSRSILSGACSCASSTLPGAERRCQHRVVGFPG